MKMKNCKYLGKAIFSPLMLGSGLVKNFCLPKNGGHFEFSKFLRNTNAYISKTVLNGANSTKFLTCWVSLQSSHANFSKYFCLAKYSGHFEFSNFLQNTKMLIS